MLVPQENKSFTDQAFFGQDGWIILSHSFLALLLTLTLSLSIKIWKNNSTFYNTYLMTDSFVQLFLQLLSVESLTVMV